MTLSTQASFGQNFEITCKVGDLVQEIAAASSEQAQGIQQITAAVGDMDKVVQQVASGAEESASASEQMSAEAQHMNEVVGALVGLINGGRKRGAAPGVPEAAAGSPALKGVPPQRAVMPARRGGGRGGAVTPEAPIPLNDQGFKDF